MEDKMAREKGKMNKQEFLLNKPLLKEINDKKKTTVYGGGSLYQAGEMIAAGDNGSLYRE